VKAELLADGTMRITPESSAEAFALNHWAELYFPSIEHIPTAGKRSAKLLTDAVWPPFIPIKGGSAA
jgi:hypothetical protein